LLEEISRFPRDRFSASRSFLSTGAKVKLPLPGYNTAREMRDAHKLYW